MLNSALRYMLDNDPNKTLSARGYKIRTFIKPAVFSILDRLYMLLRMALKMMF